MTAIDGRMFRLAEREREKKREKKKQQQFEQRSDESPSPTHSEPIPAGHMIEWLLHAAIPPALLYITFR